MLLGDQNLESRKKFIRAGQRIYAWHTKTC
uniref:Uncharacterized protein n=1 Tax=Rhizophora mucronata TaxID=61149 RepID=A0A2P2J1Q1_RHIMU